VAASFPRNWDYFNEPAAGLAPSITLPAIATITHVLTSVVATVQNSTAAAVGACDVTVQILAVNTVIALTGYLPASEQFAASAGSWTGSIASPPGGSLIVLVNPGVAGTVMTLEAQGFDF
jgi:hypothetical protein